MVGRCAFVVALVMIWGCQSAEDPAVTVQRQKYLLSEEPSGALGVMEARTQLVDVPSAESPTAESPAASTVESPTTSRPIVLLGRVGAGPNQTWEPGKAAFVITDPTAEIPDHDHGSGHDHDHCPFCQAKQQSTRDATALVRVVDPAGQVVSTDARRLFDLKIGQIVVVRGTASIDDLGNLVVAADGVYPRR